MFTHFCSMIYTGGHLTILESVDSTNNYAMASVRTGLAKHGDSFFAMAQSAGKGQRGKHWITQRGSNIIITLVMEPKGLQLQQQVPLSIAVALGVYDFFVMYAGNETSIKWPNDIYWRDRKAGGILIESVVGSRGLVVNTITPESELLTPDSPLPTSHSAWLWAIIGIGININQTSFPENIRNAVSLKQITGKDHDVIELAKELCGCVQNRFERLVSGEPMHQEYNSRLYKKGQTVTFKQGSRVFAGIVKEVTLTGELVVETAVDEYFSFGEVEWIIE